jgi:ATP-binding cassette subfamily B protein
MLELISGKLHGAASQLRIVWQSARLWTLAWLALLAAQGALPVATIYLARALVDNLSAAVAGDPMHVTSTLWLALALGVIALGGELMRSVADAVRSAQAKRVEDHVSALIHTQSTSIDIAFYESADFHDHLHRARDEAAYRPVALLENAGGLVQNGITLVAMAAVLLPYGIWMSAALLASSLPALVVVMRFAIRHHQWKRRAAGDERRAWYYDWLMTAGDAAAELRLFGLGGFYRAAYQALRARLRRSSSPGRARSWNLPPARSPS